MPPTRTVKYNLSIMMFLQYAVWGAWVVSLGGYMATTLGFTGVQIGSVYSTTAIAAMISPLFMGYVADRLFATERVIAVLHLLGAALLGVAAFATKFNVLYPVMIIYALCYMPTLALTNSITFANIGDPEKEFPHIRVWGTWGWIVVGWTVGFVLQGAAFSKATGLKIPPNAPILLAAGLSALLGFFSFFLPHTPPRGKTDTQVAHTGGLGIGELLKNPTFLVFVASSFLICIPLSFYYGFANVFLTEISAPYPTALQTVGQISEVFFMSAMPFFIQRLGVKKMLAVGMLAWVARYLAFGTLSTPLVIFGLVLHGVCYDFFFVASQIYVDTRVSTEHRARAQSFIAFITLGLGMFIGSYVGGEVFDRYGPVMITATKAAPIDGETAKARVLLPDDLGPDSYASSSQAHGHYLIRGGNSVVFEGSFGQIDVPNEKGIPSGLAEKPRTFTDSKTGESMTVEYADFLAAVKQADLNGDQKVTSEEWVMSRRHDWFHIWLWPALAALATCVVFWFGFRDQKNA